MRTVRIPIHRQRYRGFNFAEVLFAVMILGVGFIMVAAMFPVAIQQSKASTNETVAARVAEAALELVRLHANDTTFPKPPTAADDRVHPLEPELIDLIKSDLISSIDPRYGWTLLYRRPLNADYARVYLVVMQVNNRPRYTSDDLFSASPTNPSTFQPIRVWAQFVATGLNGGVEFFDNGNNELAFAQGIATEGAVLIRADNGNVYRLGRQVGTNQWELALGHGMVSNAEETSGPVAAYLIGRGHDNPNPNPVADANYTGTNQVIAVYSAIVPIRPVTTP